MLRYLTFPPFLLLILLNVLPSLFLTQIVFDNAPEVYLPPDQAGVVLKKDLEEIFPGDQNAIILFQGDDLYSDQFLERLHRVTQELKREPNVERVVSVTEMEHIEGTEDGFEVSELLGKEKRDEISKALARYQFAQSDRIASGMTVSHTPHYMAIMIRPEKIHSTIERIDLMVRVDEILTKNNIIDHVIARAGPVVVEIEQFRSTVRDTIKFVPGTVIVGLLFIWLIFRQGLAVLVAGITTGAVVSSAMLLFVVFSVPYTMIASMLAPMLASLTTAFLIHFYSYLKLASSYHYQGKKRVSFALKQVKKPVFFTALTTVLGLASLSASPILPIGHFGLIAASGVTLLCFLVLFIIPPVFIQFDKNDWSSQKHKVNWLDKLLKSIVALSIRRAGWALAFVLLLLVIGGPFILKVNAETNLLKFFPEGHFVTENTQLVEDKLTGVMPLEVVLTGDARDSLKKLKNLEQIEQLSNWLVQQPEIDRAISLVDFLEDMHRAMNYNDPAFLKLPDNDPLISQYFFIYDGDEVYELVDREFNKTRIVISLHEHNSRNIRTVIERIENYLQDNISGMTWAVGGEGRLFADQDRLLISGQIDSLLVAVLMIFLIMLYLWKSLSIAVLSMLPNLSPIAAIFIFMGIFGIWLDMATAMIASVAIGIAVDDTVHLLYGYKKRLDSGCSVLYALVQSYYKTGRAIVVTTMILCAQFLLVATADFVPISHFGLLTAIGLFIALIFDLILLPALIVIFYHKTGQAL